ncbi:prolyl 4-hydroxylase subunit alpha-2 [Drosophila eugracilis]|uniref:prolyl 4-hydroxylase subunit alpha-2 n=1 Tax=Drosophila eugracilis TaxID=29029 RepID=UPI001BDAFB82|nr:prolyl 4-hydroxylase subunit alpha-2 [Drosophila eugracilis]XP_041673573.1 prolyl 4-hydroxylase subunit alpha-2 [Drosophila eugracilis]XP_041673574.1 prolyl 4-hydroxylase subunit alpha-2 [Drosophila eugracilis]XP_041673575.1 prolyl 4-hydroxylase subunit alpha-2 [Drosophila eugracilis]
MAMSLWSAILLLILVCPIVRTLEEKRIRGLLNLERDLLQNLLEYAQKLEEKISLINSSLEDYFDDIDEAKRDPEEYLSNPLNAFRLIRHMHQDWVSWQVYMEEKVGPDQVAQIDRLLPQLPQKSAFKKAAKEVHSLTQFYGYEPASLVAKNERNSSLHLSPLDCYQMGLELYEEHDYLGAAKWLKVAAEHYTLSKYSGLYDLLGAPRWQVYRDLARALFKLNRESFNDAYATALRLNSQNVHLIQEVGQTELLSLRDPMEPILDPEPSPSVLERHCRGGISQGRLKCELNSWVHSFLEYAPLKFEELSQDPYTILYPGSIYESEMKHVEHAFEQCPPNVQFELMKGVTGCSISDGYSPVLKRINGRILDMTGVEETWKTFFIVEYAQLQAFEPFNLLRNSTKFPQLNVMNSEDIEATVLIFLRDVTLGGAITMPKEDLFVQPRRGNVLITLQHKELATTICPNIAGSGLVMIKFILKKEE